VPLVGIDNSPLFTTGTIENGYAVRTAAIGAAPGTCFQAGRLQGALSPKAPEGALGERALERALPSAHDREQITDFIFDLVRVRDRAGDLATEEFTVILPKPVHRHF